MSHGLRMRNDNSWTRTLLKAGEDKIALCLRYIPMDHADAVSLSQNSRQHLNHISERREHNYLALRHFDQFEDRLDSVDAADVMTASVAVIAEPCAALEELR